MFYPDKKTFIKKAKKGNLIPVFKEILADMETPVSAYRKIASKKYGFLLESVEGGENIARYSFLGADPAVVFSSKGAEITILENGKKKISGTSRTPLDELRHLMSGYKPVEDSRLPRFYGGAVGYISYDSVRFFEPKIPDSNTDTLGFPDMFFMITDTIVIFDHVNHTMKVVGNAFINGNPAEAYDNAVRKINAVIAKLRKPLAPLPAESYIPVRKSRVRSNMTMENFKGIVNKAKEYIKAGDIIQVVLSQRFCVDFRTSEFNLYRALRSVNPSPYMFYLKLGDIGIIGSSPEVHVRCEDGNVELRPIAGTRGRGSSEEEDIRLQADLLKDEKEKAEHIMLVDLGRNDIGRVCNPGSVKVRELMVIEKYSHVMHIVSDIGGRLKKGFDIYDLVKATFPAGTVSGAPKIRAMQIIDELEKDKRGIYSGAIGYFSFSGNLDSAIAIRTMVVKGKRAFIQAGAGIVADSVPSKEFAETVNKAKAMVKAVELAETFKN
ncbi:MAG: anthranilate synthase component I [Candidatus Aureabacteria bacterium]|nr:anthranilate synthase component I [Candidatus Auribacterota bacterium]